MKLIRTCMGLAWMAFAYVFVANALLCTSLQWNLNKLVPIRGGSLGFIDALTRGTSINWNVLNLYMNIYLLTDDWQEPSIMGHLICNGRTGTTIADLITKLEISLLIIIVGYFLWGTAQRNGVSKSQKCFKWCSEDSECILRLTQKSWLIDEYKWNSQV